MANRARGLWSNCSLLATPPPPTTTPFRLDATGGPEVLRFADVEVGVPGPNEVRLRNTAVAVNYRDVLVRRGAHRVTLPSGIGLESAGVIAAVGAGVTDLR